MANKRINDLTNMWFAEEQTFSQIASELVKLRNKNAPLHLQLEVEKRLAASQAKIDVYRTIINVKLN
jgi:hypothetical protein